jgi:hypothetical protein
MGYKLLVPHEPGTLLQKSWGFLAAKWATEFDPRLQSQNQNK